MQSTNQEARHDLVAHTQQQRRIEHIVRQGHCGAHGDGVARKQAQLHAGQALCDAIAHGWNTASHLNRRPDAGLLRRG
jgi:hypothetical protein